MEREPAVARSERESAAQCFAHCSNNGFLDCTLGLDSTCGTGTCTTGGPCTEATLCPNAGTCVFPNQCLAASCDGNTACADNELTVDYCQGALGALPVPLNQGVGSGQRVDRYTGTP